MDYIETMKKDIKLVKSENLKLIEERFEPETNCDKCYFCYKPNPEYKNIDLRRCCLLNSKMLDDSVVGCYGGYRLKENKKLKNS